jgi:hypothetical protein
VEDIELTAPFVATFLSRWSCPRVDMDQPPTLIRFTTGSLQRSTPPLDDQATVIMATPAKVAIYRSAPAVMLGHRAAVVPVWVPVLIPVPTAAVVTSLDDLMITIPVA